MNVNLLLNLLPPIRRVSWNKVVETCVHDHPPSPWFLFCVVLRSPVVLFSFGPVVNDSICFFSQLAHSFIAATFLSSSYITRMKLYVHGKLFLCKASFPFFQEDRLPIFLTAFTRNHSTCFRRKISYSFLQPHPYLAFALRCFSDGKGVVTFLSSAYCKEENIERENCNSPLYLLFTLVLSFSFWRRPNIDISIEVC